MSHVAHPPDPAVVAVVAALRADLRRVTTIANDRKADLDRCYRKIDTLTRELAAEQQAHAHSLKERLHAGRKWWWG